MFSLSVVSYGLEFEIELYETCLTSFSPRANPKCASDYKVYFPRKLQNLAGVVRGNC